MKIFWSKKSSKKGSALMSVMCMMTFVIMMATIALTAVSSAHTNMVHEYKIQQAYYTAKSAAEATASYISDINGPNSSAGEKTLAKELSRINGKDGEKIEGKWTTDTSLGDYKVDIYGTPKTNVFKIVATSKYVNTEGSVAMIIEPSSGGGGIDDAVVSTGGETDLGGSPHWEGSMSINNTDSFDFGGSSGFVGGSICNTGSIELIAENGMHQQFFQDYIDSGKVLRVAAGKNLSFWGTTACTYDDTRYSTPKDSNISVWNYFSYFVCKGNMTADKFPNNPSSGKMTKVGYYVKGEKAILCGGDFISGSEQGFQFSEFYMPFYVKGEMRINKKANENFMNIYGDVYIKGNLTTSMNINIYGGSLYVGGNINKNDGAQVNVPDGETVVNCGDFDTRAAKYEAMYQRELKYSENAKSYTDWPFDSSALAKMGANGESVTTHNPHAESGHPNDYYDYEFITESGKWDPTGFNGSNISAQGGGGIVFDTNDYVTAPTYDANGKMISEGVKKANPTYHDIYVMATKDVIISNKPSIEIWGRGNVYIYLPNKNKWQSNEVAIYSKDFPNEAHFYIISNWNTDETIVDLGSLNATAIRGYNPPEFIRENNNGGHCSCFCYIYCPNGAAQITGSSGLSGCLVAKKPSVDSGSNTSDMYVAPLDSQGNPIGLKGYKATTSYSPTLYSRR